MTQEEQEIYNGRGDRLDEYRTRVTAIEEAETLRSIQKVIPLDEVWKRIRSERKNPHRMRINQPSPLDPLHKLNRTRVLALHAYDNTYSIYFLEGNTISMQVVENQLMHGWGSIESPSEWKPISDGNLRKQENHD